MAESDDALFAALALKLAPQSTLRRAWPLPGGVSAQVTALELAGPDGGTQRLVVRRYGAADLRNNPCVAADEFRLLTYLHAAGLPVPQPYYADESGTLFPTPYVVIEFIEGATDLAPADLPAYLQRLAALLARIHRLAEAPRDLAFLPRQADWLTDKLRRRPAILDESLDEGRIRAALEAGWPRVSRNPPVLVHGDFWPGNVLWQGDRLAAILDWETARLGDPLADLGNARLEILFFCGPEALQAFTAHYLALTAWDTADLPYWDLVAALRVAGQLGTWGLDPALEQPMRARHRWFITQAFAAPRPLP